VLLAKKRVEQEGDFEENKKIKLSWYNVVGFFSVTNGVVLFSAIVR